ncbi:hypothetical protein DXG03_002798 [Asterophora parasitica]|uniref:C2 domain-containing protein n=1 Tax=Asterophora parasitica TaxID=117018 RepID=A0A9P7G403_9AGAR|nr:hypothetical protein DXG03_002798 [Asterophora parasitica]
MSSGSGLPPSQHASFAVISRIISCLVTEQLLRGIYIPIAELPNATGVLVVLSTHLISERPIISRSLRPNDIFAIVPLRHAPVFYPVTTETPDYKHGQPVGLVDPLDMRPEVFELSETTADSVDHNPPQLPSLTSAPIEWEQSLVAGHPTHPMHRARMLPLSLSDYDWYRPRIRFVRVHRANIKVLGPFETEILKLAKGAAERSGQLLREDPSTIVMPVHELQIPSITAKFPDVEVLHPDINVQAFAQSSIRTVVIPELPGLALKLAVGVKISSSLRTISHFTADFGPRFSSDIVPKLSINPSILSISREPASAVYDSIDPDLAKHFTAILREEVQLQDGQALIVSAALLEMDHAGSPGGVSAVESIFKLDTYEKRATFLDRYIRLACEALLPPLIHNGVAFEAHAQNVLARFDVNTGETIGFVVRDLGGLRIHPDTLRQSTGVDFQFLPSHCVATETLEETYPKFYHTFVHNHIQRLIRILGLHSDGRGWEMLRTHMDATIPENHELRKIWLSPDSKLLPSKCLMRMRMRDSYREAALNGTISLCSTGSGPGLALSDYYQLVYPTGATKRTHVDVKGGQHPEWDSELRFPIMRDSEDKFRKLEVACFAKEPRSDDILGKGSVDITETLKTGEFDDWVSLGIDGVVRGDIYLEMTFFSNAPVPDKADAISLAPTSSILTRRPSKFAPSERLTRPPHAHAPISHVPIPSSPETSYAPPAVVLHDLLSDDNADERRGRRPLQNWRGQNGKLASSPPSSRSSSAAPIPRLNSPLPSLPQETPGELPLPSTLLPGRGGPRPSTNFVPQGSSPAAPTVLLPGGGRPRPPTTPLPNGSPLPQLPDTLRPGSGKHAPSSSFTPPRNDHVRPSSISPPPGSYSAAPAAPNFRPLTATSLYTHNSGSVPSPSSPVNPAYYTPPSQVAPEIPVTVPIFFPAPSVPPVQGGYNYQHFSSSGHAAVPIEQPPEYQTPAASGLPDPYLQARYQSPLPLPPGSTSTSSQHEHQPLPLLPPPRDNPDQARIEALRQIEEEAARRKAQEERDHALALQFQDQELERSESPPRIRQPSPLRESPDQARTEALWLLEGDETRRKEQEERDLALAMQLDRELNLESSESDPQPPSSESRPNANMPGGGKI